ncbi:MAG: sugar nucleotide-binding protein [Alphaproteobacteria bacterium]|nr:sugar nucleotide-binding protein [Alphaproteobacteria bacterium]
MNFEKKAIVGYTGFVGSNIYAAGDFDAAHNTKNIQDAFGSNPDLLIYAGMRAEKFLANANPNADYDLVLEAENNIEYINPKKLVLISTIDVFKTPIDVDENSVIEIDGLNAYGYNRYRLENWVRENFSDALIIRLPGLFGKNIKKNFIYDFINVIPSMLRPEKLEELSLCDKSLKDYYVKQNNGFYKVKSLDAAEKDNLKQKFRNIGFSALNFTDSRSSYQFYNLSRLWKDIQIALDANLTLWHPATEPVSAGELYESLTGETFVNEIAAVPAKYDYKTVYADLFGGKNGYIETKENVMKQIMGFVEGVEK